MKNIFLRVALLIVFAFAFNSCSHESISEELQMEKDNNTMLQRDPADSNNNGSNVFTHSDADNPDGEASGGGGSSTQCVKNEYSNVSENNNTYTMKGTKVFQTNNPASLISFYMDYDVTVAKNAQGTYYLTNSEISLAKYDCGHPFLQEIIYSSRSAVVVGNKLHVIMSFQAVYRYPSIDENPEPDVYRENFSSTKVFDLP
ncbi:hypothetical protein [Flavobacterium sp. NRK F7]|uniref:hypothetical protein n=1 Tax=Flavobacterium sp. NRK F7 TaxID=2954930 RepID=UPI002091DB42|nr:hypothetical protein [Flavobacterium sp. NRK F7]MCO6163658.1 hypothetical protein [Flavobacterium sp. NRK F7]